jgi:response regulator of citrate/malate metabolism
VTVIRTLIIEDDPKYRQLLHDIMRKMHHFSVYDRAASTGAEGLELAEQYQPDLVLLDLGLPDMHGFDAWRELHRLAHVPYVIPATGDENWETFRRALTFGAWHYLTKPYGYAEVRDHLERLWEFDSSLPRERALSQDHIDGMLSRTYDSRFKLPSDLSEQTLRAIQDVLRAAPGQRFTRVQIGAEVRRDPRTVSNYLNYLCRRGFVEFEEDSSRPGHPTKLYRWNGPATPPAR